MSSHDGIKTSQRVSRSCIECGRRKIRCDKKVPCQPCIRRNAAHECRRPIARVRGQLTVAGSVDLEQPQELQVGELLRERGLLQARIAELETALALSKSCTHGHASTSAEDVHLLASVEDLIPAFEQFDINIQPSPVAATEKEIVNQLYSPASDPLFMLLPSRAASLEIVVYSLQTLGWLHCAVDASTFLAQHEDFWKDAELGAHLEPLHRPWFALYLAVLAVGILYLDLEHVPDHTDLPQFGPTSHDAVQRAAHTSRIWYEAAIKEVEKFGLSGAPSLEIVQTLSTLSLCHSNFGEQQREWLLTGLAINMAMSLDMHKLGSEAAFSPILSASREWSTPRKRELGRRLWWTSVIRDWLGSWIRPPSISPASFSCQFSTIDGLSEGIVPDGPGAQSPASVSSDGLTKPSPAHYHFIMTRLSYIFYIYIKANKRRTPSMIAKAIEEIDVVRDKLPLHLSSVFPANENDKLWAAEFPWVNFQRYLIRNVLDFLQLGIARVLISAEADKETGSIRKVAVDAARRILRNYSLEVPRVYRLVWNVSAAVVAASVYTVLDVVTNPTEYSVSERLTIIDLIRRAAHELKKHAVVALHASKGSAMVQELLLLLEQPSSLDPTVPPATAQDLLRQMSAQRQQTSAKQPEEPASFAEMVQPGWNQAYNENIILGGLQDHGEAMVDIDQWDDFLLNL